MRNTTKIRCAIYTRKSSEDGLEQEFNSLDAQREACAAYIASQKHEGWKLLKTRFDDGGKSGGTLERPALQHLLQDIDAGRIDMVVVYKIDRLTRSLADFAKLVERLEEVNCSFVSVTQAFNTSSSMGRLTLNVLLSFAQFEREVTAERIRDKIAASKKKGLWMGGVPPLGYDPHHDKTRRELVINENEATTVRRLFALYEELGCLNAVTRQAKHLGLRSKHHIFASGREQGNRPLSRGQIHHILCNPIYIGLIRHKDRTWPGLHDAIIERVQWDRVQERLQSAAAKRRGVRTGKTRLGASDRSALLLGKFRDETGDILTPSHTTKQGKIHRYYVSNRLLAESTDPTGWRLPAKPFEKAVVQAIGQHLSQAAQRHALLVAPDIVASGRARFAAEAFIAKLQSDGLNYCPQIIKIGMVSADYLRMELCAEALSQAVGNSPQDIQPSMLRITAPFACRRRGVEMKIIVGRREPVPDATLRRALRNAHIWTDQLKTGDTLKQVAGRVGKTESYIRRITPLAFLSPRIQTAIMAGTQPVDLTLESLVRTALPLDWGAQEKLLGFAK